MEGFGLGIALGLGWGLGSRVRVHHRLKCRVRSRVRVSVRVMLFVEVCVWLEFDLLDGSFRRKLRLGEKFRRRDQTLQQQQTSTNNMKHTHRSNKTW